MSIVKYPGGKERELNTISKYLPKEINSYYEPFVGGGSVYLNVKADRYFINDFSSDLINLYTCVKKQDTDFFRSLDEVNTVWKNADSYFDKDCESQNSLISIYEKYKNSEIDENELCKNLENYIVVNSEKLIDIIKPLGVGEYTVFTKEFSRTIKQKTIRMKVLEFNKKHLPDEDVKENLRGTIKASVYMYMRHLYNHQAHRTNGFKAMLYLFIRDMCYSSMFRFNADGEFNVPYGGISYNAKNYDNTIKKYKDEALLGKMSKTVIANKDFETFLKEYKPSKNDFLFLDPPYFKTEDGCQFNTYNKLDFDISDQERLATYLIEECDGNFMVDIQYAPEIENLYKEGTICKNGNPLNILYFDKKYSVSFMNRNEKTTEHMIIRNYKEEGEDGCLIN